MSDLEKFTQRVLAAGLSTGHADNWEQLADELLFQAIDLRGRLRACLEQEKQE